MTCKYSDSHIKTAPLAHNRFLLSTLLFLYLLRATYGSESLTLSSQRYNLCGRYACPTEGKFKFSSGMEYTYTYKLFIKSAFDKGTNISISELKLDFQVDIKIRSCEGTMRVRGIQNEDDFNILSFDKETEGDKLLEKLFDEINKHALKFSFYDGNIYNVCPHKDETILSLNMKKGILSAFQNKMKRFDVDTLVTERDVNGVCPTYYNLERVNGTTLVVRKIKDIVGCVERYQLHSIVPTSRFIFQMKYHKWTPLNSSVVCQQTIDHGIPISIRCKEEHALNLFENQNEQNSSTTIIIQELDLVSEAQILNIFTGSIYFPEEIAIREDLSFNHKKPKKSEISELEESSNLLRELCNVTSDEFQLDAATMFSKFIHTARHLSYDALKILHHESPSICPTGMKHVQDSLPYLRSTSAISLMKDIMIDGNVSSSTSNGWLFAMALFSRPDDDVINSVTELLYSDDVSNAVLLSISTVIHSYCMWSPIDCSRHDTVVAAVSQMETFLNKTMRLNNFGKAVVIIKSLGNTGVITPTIGNTLSSCVMSYTVTTTIKVSAIEAYRRLPCNYHLQFLLDIYTNVNNDAEIRIAAYLQIMRCPTHGTMKKIKYTLQNEAVNQVGSFVWSHLKNTMKSAMLTKVEIQSILQDYDLKNKYNLDFRKFSRNYETSFYINDYGVGVFMVSNVIFSPKSYVPRSLTANFTVSLFGETINVVEVQVYIEGFEAYLEPIFRRTANFAADIVEKNLHPLRFLRSIPVSLKDKIRQLPNNIRNNFPEPKISFAAKVFGNELFYANYHGYEAISKAIEKFSPYKIIEEFLSGQEIKFDHSTVFMDISYVTPTGAGVPLNLDAVGIGITNFDMAALVNAENLFTSGDLLVTGKLKPRFSINFEGTMSAELVYQQTEIKLRSKVFTSSAIEGTYSMNHYDNISLSFYLPLNKFDIFSVETDLIYKDNTVQQELVVPDNVVEWVNADVCFWPLLDQSFGLKICSMYSLPNAGQLLKSPTFMFRGPFKFGLFIEKSDPSAKMYIFRYNRTWLERNNSAIKAQFETPDSIIERKMEALVYAVDGNYNLTLVISANKTFVEAHGLYRNTPEEKVLNFDLDINRKRHIDLILELQVKQDKRAIIYMPKLYFAITSKPVAELSGTYKWVEKKGISQCDINLHFKTNKFDSNITGYIRVDDGSAAANVHIKYKFENRKFESVKFEVKYSDHSTKTSSVIHSNFQLESTSYREINCLISLKYKKSQDHVDIKVDYISNPYLEDDKQKLYLQFLFIYKRSFNGLKLNTYLEIKKQITDVNVKLGLTHHDNPSGSTSTLLVRYAKDKDIIVRLDVLVPQMIYFHYEIKLNVTLPAVQQPAIVYVRIMEKMEREYDVDFSGTWFSGHTAMAKGVFQDKSTHYINNYNIKLQLSSRLFTEILFTGKLVYNDNDYKLSSTVDHNNIRYLVLLKHVIDDTEQYETYLEFIYNSTMVYSINNHLSFPKKELITEFHLDSHRDIYVALRGVLQRWNTNFGMELKWDVNRDPSQKFIFNIKTYSEPAVGGMSYIGKLLFEYPGHVSLASLMYQSRGNYYAMSCALEMNPSSVIETTVFLQNEITTKGVAQIGFKLLTPFENWKESSLNSGLYLGKQNFQTNGSLVWQGNQSMMFDTHGSYILNDNISSLLLSSSLNSSLPDLTALAFKIGYRSVTDEVHLEFLLQPNPKYSILISTSGLVQYLSDGTEYIITVYTRTPFLEYTTMDLKNRIRLQTENRINADFALQLDDRTYTASINGLFKPVDEVRLCMIITTPYEQYKLVNGRLIYAPEDKHVYINFKGINIELGLDLIYVYNNLSDFNLKVHVVTPFSYFKKFLILGMFNGKQLDLMCGWNSFILGFSGISYFESWYNLHYSVKLFTPVDTFKETEAVLRILIKDSFILKAYLLLPNNSKAGLILEYDSEKNKIIYKDECGDMDQSEMTNPNNRVMLKNGLVVIDTLLYPSITGMFQLSQIKSIYVLESELSFLNLNIRILDSVHYRDVLSFENMLEIHTSLEMFSHMISDFKINGSSRNVINSRVDIELTSFSRLIRGGMDVNFKYEYLHLNNSLDKLSNAATAVYTMEIKLNTPFELLEVCDIIVVLYTKDRIYESVLNIFTNYTNLQITGNFELAQNFFDANVGINVTSVYVVVPTMKFQVLRDFSKLEKEILFTFKSIDEFEGMMDVFCIKSSWYIDSKNFITLSGEIKTPFKILDELKGSLHYSHEFSSDNYFLECYMKYSNKTELKARADLTPPKVMLDLESSMEGLRSAHFIGSLKRTGNGQQVIDAVMITDNTFKIQGWSSASENVPFALEGKLVRGEKNTVVSSVNMHVKRTRGGYHILAMLHSNGKTLDIETEITDRADRTRLINLQIMTSKGDSESLHVNGQLMLQHPGVYVFVVRGSSMIGEIKASLTSEIKLWFRNGIGAIIINLDSSMFRGNSEFFAIWDPPNTVYSRLKAAYIIKDKLTEVLSSKIYFMKSVDSFANITTGLLVDLNKKWIVEANATALIPSADNMHLLSYLYLPSKELHSVVAKLIYDDHFENFEHLLLYSPSGYYNNVNLCYTVSDVKWSDTNVEGMTCLTCGSRPVFMLDNLTGRKHNGQFKFNNLIISNTLDNTLIVKSFYTKPDAFHNLILEFYYALPHVLIASADVSFKSVNNFKSRVNTTTHFTKMPNLACDILAETNPNYHQWYSKLYLRERTGLFNFTHVKKKIHSSVILNDGKIRIMFPVTTMHDAMISYIYEDNHGNVNGSSNVTYNHERIIDGNFTRNIMSSKAMDSSLIHLAVGNSYIPLGVNYLHQYNNPNVTSTVFDLKRTEFFKLKNATAFNFTGELWSKCEGYKEWSSLKILNFNRSIILSGFKNKPAVSENGVFINLKKELWMNYLLKMSKQITNNTYEKMIDINIAYPRRNFSLVSIIDYNSSHVEGDFIVYNRLLNPPKAVGLTLHTRKVHYNHRQAYAVLFHPSFLKNVTLTTNFFYSRSVLIDTKLGLDYSSDKNRKLSLAATIEHKAPKTGRNYTLYLSGRHPASKFKLDVAGVLVSDSGIHLLGNNVSYKRSYLPNHYWNGRAFLSTKDSILEIERSSLRGMLFIHGDYKRLNSRHMLSGNILKGTDTNVTGTFLVDLYGKEVYLVINLTDDATDRIQMEANIPENREAKLHIWRVYNDVVFPQISFYTALNHSRFLSSSLLWRNDIGNNILRSLRYGISYLWISAQDSVEFWTQFLRSEATDTIMDVWYDAKPDIQDFLDDLNDLKTIQDNINYFRKELNESYNKNEFFLRDIYELCMVLTEEMSLVDKFGSFPKIVNEIWESMGETGNVIRQSLVWFISMIKQVYEELMDLLNDLVDGGAEVYVSNFIRRMTEKFDTFVKDLHIAFISSAERALNELLTVLSDYWKKLMLVFEPTFIQIIHYIDSTFWASTRKLIAFIYARRDELMSSPYFWRSANFTHQLDLIYKDLSKNDVVSNFKKYFGVGFNMIYEYYFSQIPFRQELKAIGGEILGEVKELYNLPLIAYTVDNIKLMYTQAVWLYEYLDTSALLQKLIPYMYRKIYESSFSALENEMRNHKAKTRFIFEPENGVIKMEQKLPFPWHAFNETPIYEEISEYKTLKKYQSFFSLSTAVFWRYYNHFVALMNPSTWFPPFKGHALIVGSRNFITFDSRLVEFDTGKCIYLLTNDFKDRTFSIIVDYDEKAGSNGIYNSISLLADNNIITVDVIHKTVEVNSGSLSHYLPMQLNNTYVYYDDQIITVVSDKGVTLECNTNYRVCAIHVSGWYFGKLAGLLGTMNNEPSDDVANDNFNNMEMETWALHTEEGTCKSVSSSNHLSDIELNIDETCNSLFINKSSVFETCFQDVDPLPYFNMCKTSSSNDEICTFAMSYVHTCSISHSPLRIPSTCVRCELNNSTTVEEGTFIHIEGDLVPQSVDIVFIVEAKPCNKDMFHKRNVNLLISSIGKELQNNAIDNNRYALVVFGGDGVYNNIHSVVVDNAVFTNSTIFPQYFENIITGNGHGNSDIFSAIRFASKLSFRIGVSKTFILVSCSFCDPASMTLDYSVLHHNMIEKSITLHILMDSDFSFNKSLSGKIPFGLDSSTVYTRNDFKTLKGDIELKKQIKLNKSMLGYCLPLALESNGSVFTAKKLEGDNANMLKRFVTVFGKRIALTAYPNSCQNCECSADESGIPYIDCISCLFPTPINFDFELEDDGEISLLNFDAPVLDDHT